jgi:hypothetical protein
MALDVYVGSLTRYYCGEWENTAEKIARERGVPYQIREDRLDTKHVEPIVLAWRRRVTDALGGRLSDRLDWNEASDAPYFTDRPGWDGFGSLVLWAAYAEHPTLRCPTELPEEWDEDSALLRSNAEGFKSRYRHLVRNIELWLPSGFAFTFEAEDASGRKAVIGSVTTLGQQLAELNAATWKADSEKVKAWRRRPPTEASPLEERAQFAFAVMSNLCALAKDNELPMKLDY